MKNQKHLGIWMDHSKAVTIELFDHQIRARKIVIKPLAAEQINVDRHQIPMHSKEHNHDQSVYFQQIADVAREYQDVLLFGPTDAKNELFNLLKADHHFEYTSIEMITTDKMSMLKKEEFVMQHFK